MRPYVRAHGTRARALLDAAGGMAAVGRHIGGGLQEREADFLRRA